MNNLYTLFGTSDIGHFFARSSSGGRPGTTWRGTSTTRRSPTPSDITTPLLIIHSENDLRCPIEQAEQLFVALKKLARGALRPLPGREPRDLPLRPPAPPPATASASSWTGSGPGSPAADEAGG